MTSYGKGSFDGFTSYQGDTRFDGERGTDMMKLFGDVSSNVQKITQNVSQVQKLLNQIGTPQDSEEMRQRIHQRTQYTKQLASKTSQHLKNLAQLPSSMSMSEQPAPDKNSQDDVMTAPGSETRQILQTKQYSDLELLRERRDALKKLENDIVDVHALFKELGKLVHEQGKAIDRIEDNIDHTHVSLQECNKHLTKAREY